MNFFERPPVCLDVYEVFGEDKEFYWGYFSKHHYLTTDIHLACRAFIATWDSVVVAFNAVLPLPSGSLKNAYREHRLVVSPDYQGLGIGISMSECIGDLLKKEGKRLYTKTANAKLGRYRNNSTKWRNTAFNGKDRVKELDVINKRREAINLTKVFSEQMASRVCFTHEYLGGTNEP